MLKFFVLAMLLTSPVLEAHLPIDGYKLGPCLYYYRDNRFHYDQVNSSSYANAVEFICTNKDVKSGLLFLEDKEKLNKHFYINGRLKLKVSEFLYEPEYKDGDFTCIDSLVKMKDLKAVEKMPLKNLSTIQNRYKFIVFFSKLVGNYLECKIVSACDPKIDGNYIARTRFGKVLKLRFCLENNEIKNYKMELVTAG